MKENGGAVAELKTINPATEEVINRYEIITKEQINDKVKKARELHLMNGKRTGTKE